MLRIGGTELTHNGLYKMLMPGSPLPRGAVVISGDLDALRGVQLGSMMENQCLGKVSRDTGYCDLISTISALRKQGFLMILTLFSLPSE